MRICVVIDRKTDKEVGVFSSLGKAWAWMADEGIDAVTHTLHTWILDSPDEGCEE